MREMGKALKLWEDMDEVDRAQWPSFNEFYWAWRDEVRNNAESV